MKQAKKSGVAGVQELQNEKQRDSAVASRWRDLFPLCGRAVARRAEEVFRRSRRVPLPQPASLTKL
jgi:hypothetical protein